MFATGVDIFRNEIILAARVLLVTLFIIFGWGKLINYRGAVNYMTTTHVPAPQIAAAIAIAIEFVAALAILLGIFARPLALVMAIYTLASAFIAHHYWTMSGTDRLENETNFYKNVSITGGFLLLFVTGGGTYLLDATFG